MKLLIDFGNSHCKWALLNDKRLDELNSCTYKKTPLKSVDSLLLELPLDRAEEIHAISVLGDAFNTAFAQSITNRSNMPVNYYFPQNENYGVQLAYPDPAEYGADRYAALVAAHHTYDGNKIIIDCGTAVTVDAIDPSGKHLGGIIFPGEEIMRDALADKANGVFYRDQSDKTKYLNTNTSDAVQAGAALGLKHGVWGVLAEIKQSLNDPNIIITGGNAARLHDSSNEPYTTHPKLVLEGLKTMVNFNN